MASLEEFAEWVEGIYQLETSDPVLGGPDGIDNLQAKQLARRTLWLKAAIEALGLNKQPLDQTLTALAALETGANQIIYTTGADTFALSTLTAFMRTLLDDATAPAALLTLGAAPLAAPAFTGNPTAATQAAADNSTRLATTAFVKAAIAALIDQSPGTLDTLKELADALGNDPNFATTMATQLGLKAPLASPSLTGTPTAPTASAGTNTTQLATTAFVTAVQTLLNSAIALRAPLASPALTGAPTAPTAAQTVNNTQIATTAFVKAAIAAILDSSPAALDTLRELADALGNDPNFATTMATALGLKAPLASPALSGTPTAPTVGASSNNTTLATTAFVKSALADAVYLATAVRGQSQGSSSQDPDLATDQVILTNHANTPPGGNYYYHITTTFYSTISATANRSQLAVTYNAPVVQAWARSCYAGVWYDWVPLYNLVSPAFTGIPTAPTAAAGTNTTQLATTAFVTAVQTLLNSAIALRAPLASPALTGTPTAPTQAAGNSSTRLATTAFVQAAIAALIDSSPGALDTLKELADALGNDPNFATTMVNSLAQKLSLAGGTITGRVITGGDRDSGMYGNYNSALIDHVWSMGNQFRIAADGSGFGTLYGMAYKHTNNAAGGTMAGGHQIVFAQNGVPGAAIGLGGNIWIAGTYSGDGSGLTGVPQAGVTGLVAALAAKAALASPAFSGAPTTPTPAAASNTTHIANTAWVKARIGEVPKNTASLSGDSGWHKCEDTGLITQWTVLSVGDQGGSRELKSVTFPIAFPTECMHCIPTVLEVAAANTPASTVTVAEVSKTKTGCTVVTTEYSAAVQNYSIKIFAVGR